MDVLLPDNPKLDGLSPAAKWTLVELWCHCGQHLTDGFVRDAKWSRFGNAAIRRKIVEKGLATRVEGGYQMHDYLDHQRSRAEVEEVRATRSAAGKASAAARAKAKALAEQDAQQGVEHDAEHDPLVDKSQSGALSAESESETDQIPAQSKNRHSGDLPSSESYEAQHPVQQSGNKTATEAEAEAEVKTVTADAGDQSSGSNVANDDDLIDAIISELRKVTGKTITPAWAADVASSLLRGRDPDNPAAYVRAAIRSERDPRTRFLPVAASHPSARTPTEAAFAAGIIPNGRPADDQTVAAIAAQVRQAIRKGSS